MPHAQPAFAAQPALELSKSKETARPKKNSPEKNNAARELPAPVRDLQAGTYKYHGTISIGSNDIAIDSSITVAEENGIWKASDIVLTPTGQVSDISTLEKRTLIVRTRKVQQGMQRIEVSFSDSKATGTVDFSGQQRAIDVELGGPVFGDAAASGFAIGCLPLSDGYATSFRNFDLLRQKPTVMGLKVLRSEQIVVPAGTFDAYKVQLASDDEGAEKSTLWIAKATHTPVKTSIALPQIGGATITQELLP